MARKTFRTRVDDFWKWFPTIAQQTHSELSDGNVEGILADFPGKMEELLPNLSWVFGPGRNGGQCLPDDDPLGGREEIEHTLEEELGDSVLFWGGATGIEASYLDMLLLDGENSRAKIRTALERMGVDAGCRIEPFTQ